MNRSKTVKRKWKILGVDHITIAVDDVSTWKKFYESLGGKVMHETPDADPKGKSSMKLLGIRWGKTQLALVEGISRRDFSQVSKFVERHGDHSFQHIALAVNNLSAFLRDAKKLGFNFLGPILKRSDTFGPVRQVFAKRFDAKKTDAAEGIFYEFVERPYVKIKQHSKARIFSSEFAKKLYRQVEKARNVSDNESFAGGNAKKKGVKKNG